MKMIMVGRGRCRLKLYIIATGENRGWDLIIRLWPRWRGLCIEGDFPKWIEVWK